MAALLDPGIAERLAKLCGMFGSDHDGERAAAAAKADKLVRAQGLTWHDVLSSSPNGSSSSGSIKRDIDAALANLDALSQWERGFVYSIRGRRQLSDKQRRVLSQLADKARACAGCA